MISINNLTKKYGDYVAIDNLSFKVEKGEIIGLLGPNGAGKSTTMKIITGFMPPTSGTVTINGENVFDNPLSVKQNIGYLPENPPLYLDMRVEEYLIFVAKLKKLSKDKINQNLEFVLSSCGLTEVKSQVITTLSKGYKQRVGIAQAIIHQPEVIILDEPTVGLDPAQIVEIRKLILSLAGNHTVILSTHILPEVIMTCSKIVMINKGKVVVNDEIARFQEKGLESLEKEYLSVVTGENLNISRAEAKVSSEDNTND